MRISLALIPVLVLALAIGAAPVGAQNVAKKTALAWIDDNNMSTVLLRHYPELRPMLNQVDNAFAPWPRA